MKPIKMNVMKMIRPNCAGFEPYVAGKPVETIKRELGLKKVIKLASNENPLGPSKKALSAIQQAVSNVYFYPDSNSWNLKQALAKKFKLKPQNILLGCGSDEIIEILARLFFRPSDEIIASEHAFIRYQMAGQLMNCSVKNIPMKGYTHDLDAMAAAVTARTKAIFVANPNNPTGTYNTKKELESFLAAVEKKGAAGTPPLVIMDEAYYEYARGEKDYPETIKYLSRYPNLVILRTFSKIYGLAGLRVGYGFAAEQIVDYVDRIRPPFNVNSLAQLAAIASLDDKDQVKKSITLVKEGKKYLYAELKKMGIAFIPTAANFVLIDLGQHKGQDVFKKLLRCGVIVRAMGEYAYPNHIRVTIGLPSENRLFISSLKKVLWQDTKRAER